MEELGAKYWSQRYDEGKVGWDNGQISTPLKEYVDQLTDKNIRILIPGAGNCHEGEYLWRQGFKNVDIVDLSSIPLDNFKKRIPDFPESQLIESDFFKLYKEYDLILEQTFFCALNPDLRNDYTTAIHNTLAQNGKLVGVMFVFPLTNVGPPFGGSIEEYRTNFSRFFDIEVLEACCNSLPSRQGKEIFIKMSKKG